MRVRIFIMIMVVAMAGSSLAYDWERVGMEGIATTCIEVDGDERRLFVGTHEGFHIYDQATDTWSEFDDEGWIGRQVYAVQADPSGAQRIVTGRENAFWKGYLELTVDGGATGDVVHASQGGAFVGLAHDGQYFYACGISDITPGELLRSLDGTAPWTPLTGHGHSAMTAVVEGAEGDLLVAGDNGVWRTLDQGDTWDDESLGLSGGLVRDLHSFMSDGDVIFTACAAVNNAGYWLWHGPVAGWQQYLDGEDCRRATVMSAPAPWPISRINRQVAITHDGRVLVMNQSGDAWIDETGSLPSPAVDAAFLYHDQGLYVTTADGVFRFFPVISAVDETPAIAAVTLEAWPNPFNPRVNLRLALPHAGSGRLAVYDLRGQLVSILEEGRLAAGAHTVTWDASRQASGVYVARLETDLGLDSVRLVLVR